jgi:hypothetical protein
MQLVTFSGSCTAVSQTIGNCQIYIRINLSGTTTYEYIVVNQYSNVLSSHFSIPINRVFQFTTAGTYDVYMYVVSNLTTDNNDVCFLNATVLF